MARGARSVRWSQAPDALEPIQEHRRHEEAKAPSDEPLAAPPTESASEARAQVPRTSRSARLALESGGGNRATNVRTHPSSPRGTGAALASRRFSELDALEAQFGEQGPPDEVAALSAILAAGARRAPDRDRGARGRP